MLIAGLHRQPVKTSPQFSQSGKIGDINSLGFDTWCWYFLTRDRSPTKPGSRVLFFEMAEEIIRKKTNFWPILCHSMENLWRREWSIFFLTIFWREESLFNSSIYLYDKCFTIHSWIWFDRPLLLLLTFLVQTISEFLSVYFIELIWNITPLFSRFVFSFVADVYTIRATRSQFR